MTRPAKMKAFNPKRAGLFASTTTRYSRYGIHTQPQALGYQPPAKTQPPLAVMPTGPLLRSLLFTSLMSSPLLNPCLSILSRVVNSSSLWLSPSQNPIVNYVLRTTIYNHFCAGENETNVQQTVRGIKDLGFRGVILGYAKEAVVEGNDGTSLSSAKNQEEVSLRAVETWKLGNLQTLKMIGEGDYLAIKYVFLKLSPALK